ncbi:MAG: hypothetical protein HeimC3_36720 [Candidatus Heimdallarchaeota archaeon LC_3]|nr:MAG: hypothetical protein HeimC3_36720 [Candidatus Heimdallarchaeota archaeon LC_3]
MWQVTDLFQYETTETHQLLRSKEFLAIVAIFVMKLFLILINFPDFNTDMVRNLQYGEAFWSHGFFNVYNLYPNDIDPGNPSNVYLTQTFSYPVFHLLFFAFFAILPYSVFILKVFLAFIDILIFYEVKKDLGLKWAIFISLFQIIFTLYGLVDGITLLLILYSARRYNNGDKRAAYLLAIFGIFWKYVSVVLLVYYIINDYNNKNTLHVKDSIFNYSIVIITSIGMLPLFFSQYILKFIEWQFNNGYLNNQDIPSEIPIAEQAVYRLYDQAGWNDDALSIWALIQGNLNPAALVMLAIFVYTAYRLIVKKELNFLPLVLISFSLILIKRMMIWYFLYAFPMILFLKIKDKDQFLWIYVGAFIIGLGYFGFLVFF